MSDDLLERLGRENPVPDQLAPLPLESVWARVADQSTAVDPRTSSGGTCVAAGGARRGHPRRRRAGERGSGTGIAVSVIALSVTVAVVAVVVLAGGAHRTRSIGRPTATSESAGARVRAPNALMPAHGGMRGLLLAATVAGSGSTVRVSFVQCSNCGATTSPDAREFNWAATSTDGGRRWRTERMRTGLLTLEPSLPDGRNVWQLGYAPHGGNPGFYASHDSGRTYRLVRAPSSSGFGAVTLGGGEAWTLGVRCPHYQCRSTVLHGPAVGDSLLQTRVQPPGMPTHRAPVALVVAGYGSRAYVSEGGRHRLYVSQDDGQSWSQTTYPCPANAVVRNLSPAGHGVVWVTCQAPLETRSGRSSGTARYAPVTIRRSIDGGRHWQTPDSAFHDTTVLVSVSGQIAWAQSLDGTLHRTTNGGRSWQTVLRGAGRSPSLDVDSASTATVVNTATAGTPADHTRRTDLVVYRTTDGGSHWTPTVVHLPRG